MIVGILVKEREPGVGKLGISIGDLKGILCVHNHQVEKISS